MRNLYKKMALGVAVSLALQGCSLFSSEERPDPDGASARGRVRLHVPTRPVVFLRRRWHR